MQARLAKMVRAVELSPQSATAYARYGLALERSGDPRASVEALRKAVSLAPHRADVYDGLGFSFYRAAASIDELVQAEAPSMAPTIQRVPGGDDPCWQRSAPDCFELEHYRPEHLHIAEGDFLQRLEKDSNDLRGFALLAMLYRNRSTTACTTALRLNPRQGTAYLTLARTLPMGGSLGLYTRALRLLPPSEALEREHGDKLRQLRYFAKANAAFRRALALGPNVPAAYHALAELRLERNRSAEALHIAVQALQLHPAATLPAAARELVAGLPEDPNLPFEWRLEADGAERGGKGERERGAVEGQADEAAEGGQPELAKSVILVAEARRQQRRLAESAHFSSAALALSPQLARAYNALGHSLYSMEEERHPEAIAACQAAVKLDPFDKDSKFRLGCLLRRVPGRLSEAIRQLQDCIHLQVDYPGGVEALDEAVDTLKAMTRPNRGWRHFSFNLAAVLTLALIAGATFTVDPR